MIVPEYREYFIFLEELRRSGTTNMFGAAPYLEEEFGIETQEARRILSLWMKNYDRKDYEEEV